MTSSEISPLNKTGIHSYHRRSFYHDYLAPFIYHIILKKSPCANSFGQVDGNAKIAPGEPGCAHIVETALGKAIAKTLIHFPYQFPVVKLLQFCVMPDHVHILLQILYRTEHHLDYYIENLRTRIAQAYSKTTGIPISEAEIFEEGYCDKPLYDNRSLQELFRYIRENPHRLAMRRQYPEFFQKARRIRIDDGEFEAYGNLFLLRNPDKEAVRISSKFTSSELKQKMQAWHLAASTGSVLVSPFISPKEKEIRTQAEALGAKIILITHEAFGERFKPAAHDFALCSEGRLLIISLGLPPRTPLTRAQCLAMNALAETIATTKP